MIFTYFSFSFGQFSGAPDELHDGGATPWDQIPKDDTPRPDRHFVNDALYPFARQIPRTARSALAYHEPRKSHFAPGPDPELPLWAAVFVFARYSVHQLQI